MDETAPTNVGSKEDRGSAAFLGSASQGKSRDDGTNQHVESKSSDLAATADDVMETGRADQGGKRVKGGNSGSGRRRNENSNFNNLNSSHVHKKICCLASEAAADDNANEGIVGVDEERVFRAIQDAGWYASGGIVAVEAWVVDHDQAGRLMRPPGGYWRSPEFNPSDALRRLEDHTRVDYVPPPSIMPGVGIVGKLWEESFPSSFPSSSATGVARSRRFMHSLSSSLSSNKINRSGAGASSRVLMHPHLPHPHMLHHHRNMVWRCLRSLVDDPDTAKGPRLATLLEAGFGYAAAVPLDALGGHHGGGIVVYYARPTADIDGKLNRPENQVYLNRAAQMVGTALAMTQARRANVAVKKEDSNAACRKFRRNLLAKGAVRRWTETIEEGGAGRAEALAYKPKSVPHHRRCLEWSSNVWHVAWRRTARWAHKCLGGDLQIPPALSTRQSLLTLVGAFCGLLLLSAMSEIATDVSGGEYYLLIGPFGALMTLQYGLSSAPASQPRNAVLGQCVAGSISLAFTYIPESSLPTWLRTAVGPAFAIAAMVRLGIPHPPAGAHSVLYASGKYDWTFWALVVLGSVLSVAPATIINNLSSRRQYPTFWGYIPSALGRCSSRMLSRLSGGKEKEPARGEECAKKVP